MSTHVGYPGIKVCPITTHYGSFEIRNYLEPATLHPTLGRQIYIETHPLVGESAFLHEKQPNRFMSADTKIKGPIANGLEAFKVRFTFFDIHFEMFFID
jgi:hypothetical protein